MISDQVILIDGGYVVAEGEIRGVRSEVREHPIQVLIRCDRPSVVASRLFEQDHVHDASFSSGTTYVAVTHGPIPSLGPAPSHSGRSLSRSGPPCRTRAGTRRTQAKPVALGPAQPRGPSASEPKFRPTIGTMLSSRNAARHRGIPTKAPVRPDARAPAGGQRGRSRRQGRRGGCSQRHTSRHTCPCLCRRVSWRLCRCRRRRYR